MQPNHEYIKQLLMAMQSSPNAYPMLSELIDGGLKPNAEMLFHLELLNDYDFIESKMENKSLGLEQFTETKITWKDVPLRLTAAGHEFIQALETPEVWETIKNRFCESSVQTIFDVGKHIVKEIAKTKVESCLKDFKI